jgi:hypothetical protein
MNFKDGAIAIALENQFPWMSEATDLKKGENFFETRVIEYQYGGALNREQSIRRGRCVRYAFLWSMMEQRERPNRVTAVASARSRPIPRQAISADRD